MLFGRKARILMEERKHYLRCLGSEICGFLYKITF
jgi:hypothetical protein